MHNFGTLLKKLRMNSGYTQKEFADKLNTTDTTVSNWENNKRFPDILALRDISRILNVSYEELLNPTETLEKKSTPDNVTIVESPYNDTHKKALSFSLKQLCILAIIVFFLVLTFVCLLLVKLPRSQPEYHFIEARTNVETSLEAGTAYELIYCINTKVSTDLLLTHSESLAEAWKAHVYNDCNENIFIVSYYLSVEDINKSENVYFQAFTLNNISQ